jgi:hypothetical protein
MESLAAYISLGISIGAVILGIINHKRIRSSCCGATGSVSLDIEATTPTAAGPKTTPLLDAVHSDPGSRRVQSEEECNGRPGFQQEAFDEKESGSATESHLPK